MNENHAITPEEILADPAASYWLKETLRACLKRDAVDALNDAETLARVLERRLTKLHSKDLNSK